MVVEQSHYFEPYSLIRFDLGRRGAEFFQNIESIHTGS